MRELSNTSGLVCNIDLALTVPRQTLKKTVVIPLFAFVPRFNVNLLSRQESIM